MQAASERGHPVSLCFFHFAWRSLCDFPSDKHQECKQQVRGDTQSQLRHRQLHAAAPCRSVKMQRQIQKKIKTNKQIVLGRGMGN